MIKRKLRKRKKRKTEKNESLAKLEMELSKHQTNLKFAEESIKIGNQKPQEAFSEKSLSRENIQSALLIWYWSENVN